MFGGGTVRKKTKKGKIRQIRIREKENPEWKKIQKIDMDEESHTRKKRQIKLKVLKYVFIYLVQTINKVKNYPNKWWSQRLLEAQRFSSCKNIYLANYSVL